MDCGALIASSIAEGVVRAVEVGPQGPKLGDIWGEQILAEQVAKAGTLTDLSHAGRVSSPIYA